MTNILSTKKRFNKVYLEITNVCNLACPFCVSCGRDSRFMSEEEFTYAAAEIKTVSDYVYLHLLGEPTLHPLLDRFLEICLGTGLTVNLTTNGTNPDRLPFDSDALRKVTFSLHAAEANGLDMKKYACGVRSAIRRLAAHGKIIELRLWNGKKNDELISLLGELPERTYVEYGDTFVWPHDSKASSGASFCMGLRDQCGILCDGSVVPCCLDSEGEIKLGNIFEGHLTDILSGERANALVDGFSCGRAVEQLCRRCNFYTIRSNKS